MTDPFGEDGGAPSYRPTPEPVVTVPDEMADSVDETNLSAAAAVVSLKRLVARRVGWSVAWALAVVARWIGEGAAYAVRQEATARHAATVARYERKLMAARMTAHKWKTKCEAKETEAQALTDLHVRTTERIKAETLATRAGAEAIAQRMTQ